MGSMRGALIVGALVAVGVLVWIVTLDRAPDLDTDAAIPRGEAEASLTGSTPSGGPALQGTGTVGSDEALKGTIPAPAPVDPATLDPVRDIFGIVVDEKDVPVAGATVSASEYTWRSGLITASGYYEAMQLAEARAATDGSFRLRIRPGQIVSVLVQHAGFAATEVQSVSGGAHLRIVLRPGVRLVLTLEAPDGGPAADVSVGLWRVDRTGGGTSFRQVLSTGPDGRVTFDSLPGGVEATLEPEPVHEGWGRPGWERLQLQESGEQHYTYRLPTGRTIRGHVTDADTGQPIEGARVGMNWVLDGEVKTDREGAYEMPGWTGKGITDIQALAKGYVRGAVVVGDQTEIDFELQRGFAIEGRIVEESGEGVPHARIAAVGSEHRGGEQTISLGNALSGAEGTFRIDGLDPSLPHTIQVRAVEHASIMLDIDAAAPGETVDLGDIQLSPPAVIEGRVIDGEGQGYANIAVRVGSKTTGRTSRRASGASAQTSYGGSHEVRTDERGHFRVADLAPGPWEVSASAPGAAPVQRTVVAPRPDDEPPLEIVLGRTRTVTITVLDPEGKPVAEAYVQDKARTSSQRTNDEGQVAFSLPLGRAAEVTVWPIRRNDLRQLGGTEVPADVTEIVIRLERSVLVRGTLMDEAGQPLKDAVVYAFRGEERVGMGAVDGDGAFAIDVGGSDEVLVRWNGDYVMRGPALPERPLLTVEPARAIPEGEEVHLVARRAMLDRTLRVEVRAPDGSPLVTRVAVGGGMKRLGDGTTDDSGVVVLEGLPPMQVYVSTQLPPEIKEPWLTPPTPHVVPDGQTVTLQFVQGVWLDLTVRKANGEAATQRRLHMSNSHGDTPATWTRIARTDALGHVRVAVDPTWPEGMQVVVYGPDPDLGLGDIHRVDPSAGAVEITLDE